MGFSANQLRALRRDVDRRNLRTRHLQNGRALTYIEGWHAVAEANRIFGFGGWDRETIESRCILAREIRGMFTAIYVARVRITVRTNGETVVREGHGTGDGKGELPGEAHDMAIKTAETDATKRALATFGRPFGLSLYLSNRPRAHSEPSQAKSSVEATSVGSSLVPTIASAVPPGRHYATGKPDFERRRTRQRLGKNGRYYVPRRTEPTSDAFHAMAATPAIDSGAVNQSDTPASDQVPAAADSAAIATGANALSENKARSPEKAPQSLTDETAFLIAHPRRVRNKDHLIYVGTQPCLLCGRTPSDAHHLRYAQPRAMSRKVSDEFTVPLCRTHHRQLHRSGDESACWNDLGVDPLPIAQELWQHGRNRGTSGGDTVGSGKAQPSGEIAEEMITPMAEPSSTFNKQPAARASRGNGREPSA